MSNLTKLSSGHFIDITSITFVSPYYERDFPDEWDHFYVAGSGWKVNLYEAPLSAKSDHNSRAKHKKLYQELLELIRNNQEYFEHDYD